jgi:hypothetical protein
MSATQELQRVVDATPGKVVAIEDRFITRSLIPTRDQIEVVKLMAETMYRGGMTGNGVDKPEKLAIKILAGLEVGLRPIAAANWIMLTNGRTSIYGDGALAIVRASGLLESFAERTPEEAVQHGCGRCTLKRKGFDESVYEFSIDDARRAGLWGQPSPSPWHKYPGRMLQMRARAWALRDVFTDVLCGLAIAEEEHDIPPRVVQTEDAPRATPTENTIATRELVRGDEPITAEQLAEIATARAAWLGALGIDPANAVAVDREWKGKLHFYHVRSAKSLTQESAAALLADLRNAVKPFTADFGELAEDATTTPTTPTTPTTENATA